MEVDLNEIDNRLSQIVPDGSQEQGTDAKSAEGKRRFLKYVISIYL